MGQEAERFLKESLNCEISGGALIRDLGVAQRKLVQIARALIDNRAKIVVFDEPTAPLPAPKSTNCSMRSRFLSNAASR